jgi:hypothetical protein
VELGGADRDHSQSRRHPRIQHKEFMLLLITREGIEIYHQETAQSKAGDVFRCDPDPERYSAYFAVLDAETIYLCLLYHFNCIFSQRSSPAKKSSGDSRNEYCQVSERVEMNPTIVVPENTAISQGLAGATSRTNVLEI